MYSMAESYMIPPFFAKPVSYTHLDVYKRQSQGLPDLREIPSCVGGNPKKRTGIVAVSYTHLDVYKRQKQNRPEIMK